MPPRQLRKAGMLADGKELEMRGALACLACCLGVLALLAIVTADDCVPTKSKPCPVAKPEPKIGRDEAVYDGYIRAIQFQQRAVLYESTSGFVKTFDPVCPEPTMLPVWQGMRVASIHFHWSQTADGPGCFQFDQVEHSPLGDAK